MADREGLTFVSLRSLRNALREVEESRDHGQRVRTLICGRVLIPPFVFKQSLFSLTGTWPLKLGTFYHGGQGGIRTLGDITATHAFQACSFDHSDTCPLVVGAEPRRPNPEWQPDFGKCRRFFPRRHFFGSSLLSHRDTLSCLIVTNWHDSPPFVLHASPCPTLFRPTIH
jgi:hypothetical protein